MELSAISSSRRLAVCAGKNEERAAPVCVSIFMIRPCVLASLLSAFALLPAKGKAQAPASAVAPIHVDTVVHRLPIDSTRLQPAHLVYRSVLERDSTTTVIGDQQFVVSPLDYAGTPAWMLARQGQQGVSPTTDSLVVRRSDLRPLHWTTTLGPARLAAEFTPDTVFGAMTSPLGKQTLILPNRPDLLVNTMGVDAIVGALPLTAGWRDSATVLVVDAGGSALAPATIAVDGEEHVVVPAGEYDCWVVSVETERGSERLWVTKQGQLVVRAEEVLPQLGGATLQRVLVQTDSLSAAAPASARFPD